MSRYEFMRNFSQVNGTEHIWRYVYTGSNIPPISLCKALPEPILAQIYVAESRHKVGGNDPKRPFSSDEFDGEFCR